MGIVRECVNVAPYSVNVLSLFSGVGGLDLGVRIALPSARCVCYVEGEAYAAAVLAARMEDGSLDDAPVWSDVRTFDGRPWRGVVDLIVGGFPCQDISNAGKREGIEGSRSGLWSEFTRIIREVGPRYVFVENVSALLGRGMGTVLEDLANLGFNAEWGVFSAAEVGASHLRKRVFVLAHAARDGRREGQSASTREPRRPDAAECGAVDVGDTAQQRLAQRGGVAGCLRAQLQTADGASLPIFPPGPNDAAAWSRIPAEAQPCVRGDADGPADRVDERRFANRIDRLRGVGNGVVSICGAVALLELAERLGVDL